MLFLESDVDFFLVLMTTRARADLTYLFYSSRAVYCAINYFNYEIRGGHTSVKVLEKNYPFTKSEKSLKTE